jgi:hypothetical protein
MHRNTLFSALSLILVTAACSAAPSTEPIQGSGGSMAGPSSSSAGGKEASSTVGQGGSGSVGQGGGVSYPTAIGAAYPNGGDGRVVLIDATGTRTVLYNPAAGTFASGDDIDELEGGPPISEVVAAARLPQATYMFDAAGAVTVYDHAQASFSPPELLADALDDIPFSSVGAAFGYGDKIFVFNAGGVSYAVYNTVTETWSPTYSFAADFGGGGAPIASVGAAYFDGDSAIVLFDKSGTTFCTYAISGEFSGDFDIEELGDGSLSFDDVAGD